MICFQNNKHCFDSDGNFYFFKVRTFINCFLLLYNRKAGNIVQLFVQIGIVEGTYRPNVWKSSNQLIELSRLILVDLGRLHLPKSRFLIRPPKIHHWRSCNINKWGKRQLSYFINCFPIGQKGTSRLPEVKYEYSHQMTRQTSRFLEVMLVKKNPWLRKILG